MVPVLHQCSHLHARISATQCAVNRAQSNEGGPCRGCTDWTTWAAAEPIPAPTRQHFFDKRPRQAEKEQGKKKEAENIAVAAPQKDAVGKHGKCACGRDVRYPKLNLCSACYMREYKAKGAVRKREAAQTPVTVSVDADAVARDASAPLDAATYFEQQREAEARYRFENDAAQIFESVPVLPEIFDALADARTRHPDFATTPMAALALLLEGVGEVARALNDDDQTAQRKELLHVCAVAMRWLSDEFTLTG